MPWSTPPLRDVRSLVRDAVNASLPGADANIPNSVLRVMSDNQGALCHLTLQYVDWLALQLLPDTAETEWLDRHGNIWLVNSDGTKGRKMATLSSGTASFQGIIDGTVLPAGTQLQSAVGMPQGSDSPNQLVGFETMADITTSAFVLVSGPVRALDTGSAGNVPDGTGVTMLTPVDGVSQTGFIVQVDGGTDGETDDQLRARILQRIRNPPMGGSESDYVRWALSVPGVTRAWAASEMGIGTITVRFLMDDLRAADDGWPNTQDVATVQAYIDTQRPVTTKDCFVTAPIKEFMDVTIAALVPNTPEMQAEIEASIRDMLFALAAPGQTIFAAWVSYAIMSAPGVVSFRLVTDQDLVMPSLGHMAVLETILYEP